MAKKVKPTRKLINIEIRLKLFPHQQWADVTQVSRATVYEDTVEAWLQGFCASFQNFSGSWPEEVRWNIADCRQGQYFTPDKTKPAVLGQLWT